MGFMDRLQKNVQDSRRRLWLDASQQCIASFADLNAWLEARCRALWSELSWPERQGVTLQEALELEQPELMPMPGMFDGWIGCWRRLSLCWLPGWSVLSRSNIWYLRLPNRRRWSRLTPYRSRMRPSPIPPQLREAFDMTLVDEESRDA